MLPRALVISRSHCLASSSSSRIAFRELSMESRKRRAQMFDEEKARQSYSLKTSVEKAVVTVVLRNGEEKHLLMNDKSSSYLDCLKHVSRVLSDSSALVHVKDAGEGVLSSVHSNIAGESTLQPIQFNSTQFAHEVNQAYWRSCAFLLGAVAESSFHSEVRLLHAHPPDYESGRFSYSAEIDGLKGWNPSKEELGILSRVALRNFIGSALPFTPLLVDHQFAADVFKGNVAKEEEIAKNEDSKVVIYKVGEHVDLCDGPLIANTAMMGRFAVTQVDEDSGVYTFSGVSLPASLRCSSFSWDLIQRSSLRPSISSETQNVTQRIAA